MTASNNNSDNNNDNAGDIHRPHGETGDTVQQAADVSKPTKPAPDVAQPPPDSTVGTDTRESVGGGANVRGGADTGSDAMPGRSNAL